MYERVNMWTCGRVGMWTCGRVGTWTCGRVGTWTCGWRGLCYLFCFIYEKRIMMTIVNKRRIRVWKMLEWRELGY